MRPKAWQTLTLWHDEMWSPILRRDPCVYCHAPSDSIEHVDPRGSRSAVKNGVGACRACNHERGSAPLLVYLMWRLTDRAESFSRWNWRQYPLAIQRHQLLAKANAKARRLLRKSEKPEALAPSLRVTIADRVGETETP